MEKLSRNRLFSYHSVQCLKSYDLSAQEGDTFFTESDTIESVDSLGDETPAAQQGKLCCARGFPVFITWTCINHHRRNNGNRS